MNPRVTNRDLASPLQWGRAGPGRAWHHIIPFSLLRDVWNRLVDRYIATDLAEARTAIRHYLLLADRNQPDIDALLDRLRAENARRRAAHHQLQPLTVAEALRLATAAVWPAWNAVEGPRNRSDDPQDSYIDRFTFGLTPVETARMRTIEFLFAEFERFVNAGPTPGPNQLRALAQALAVARPTVWCESPIRYRAEMWVEETPGRWRKRRHED